MGGETPNRAITGISKIIVRHHLPIICGFMFESGGMSIAYCAFNVFSIQYVAGRIVGAQAQQISIWPDVTGRPSECRLQRDVGATIGGTNKNCRIRRCRGGCNELDIGAVISSEAINSSREGIILVFIHSLVIRRSAGVAERGITGYIITIPILKKKFDVLRSVPSEGGAENNVEPASIVIG